MLLRRGSSLTACGTVADGIGQLLTESGGNRWLRVWTSAGDLKEAVACRWGSYSNEAALVGCGNVTCIDSDRGAWRACRLRVGSGAKDSASSAGDRAVRTGNGE